MTIINRFLEIVSAFPNNIAMLSETEGEFTYHDLNLYSNYIANIIKSDERKSGVVGIFLNRSFGLIASMIGVMKAGKAYLPLDPSYPKERLNIMLENSNVSKIITNLHLKDILTNKYNILVLEDTYKLSGNSVNLSKKEEAACILYTSGSTGLPNGVIMSHEAVLNTLEWAIKFYKLTDNDTTLQVPSCSFTSSVQDIFSTLLSGGKLVILNENRMFNARYLNTISKKYRVTHFDMVPSLYKVYLKAMENPGYLRFVLLAGEPLQNDLIKSHFEKAPNVRLMNEYGMAETCSCCFVKEIKHADDKVTIGKPIDNISYKIVDEDDEGIGELFIIGKGLSSGYHNNAERSNLKFQEENGKRFLKTGDYVREDENGEIVYICRKDDQIKVNGKRINLSEIDSVLKEDINIVDSITSRIEYKNKQLIVSYIISECKNTSVYYERIRNRLPSHYIPGFILVVDDFPYLPNRKINFKKLNNNFIKLLENDSNKSLKTI